MNAFIFCALLSYFSFHFFRNKKVTVLLTVLSMIYVLVVGFSRVYLGVHYFSDVVAGYIAGFWWFVTVLLLDKTLIFYKLYKKTE
jgi:undecaprenyl-diphosphatase